jgi:anti-sigma factor RsiW
MNDAHTSPDRWNDRLSEYLDDELDPRERAEVDAHLQGCATCRADLDALRLVVARAGELTDRRPDADLWPGVQARIGSDRGAPAVRRSFTFTLPQLIAAGLALMILSGGMVWLARMGGSRTDFPPVVAEAPAPPSPTPVSLADAPYDAAIADLQRTLDEGRAQLDARTVRVLEENLETIDRAIAQCREALAGDPANVYLNSYLAEARSRKLQLLRRAASIVHKNS